MRRAKVLIVDPLPGLSPALREGLARHEVHTARDALDVLFRIDCADRPYDVVFCDVAAGDLPGPQLWAYLARSRRHAAERMVFVAAEPVEDSTRAFLARIPNLCVGLPADPEGLDALASRRAAPTNERAAAGA